MRLDAQERTISHVMDEMDFLLVNALQVYPRASWSALEGVLDIDATTLSRRWARLIAEGLAWTSCYALSSREWSTMPASACALVEVDCAAGCREDVLTATVSHPAALTVECCSGERDLLLTVVLDSTTAIDTYVADTLCRVPGVTAARTRYARSIVKDGSSWQLDVLRADQRRAIEALRGHASDVPDGPTGILSLVLEALRDDVRRPATAVAQDIGRAVTTVNRAIGQLMHAPWVRTRIEFPHDRVGWSATTVLSLAVPHLQVSSVAASIALLPQVRLCAVVLGRANLLVILWLRSFDELDDIEGRLFRAFPALEVADRWLVPRTAKRLGHVISPDGRRREFVPPDLTG